MTTQNLINELASRHAQSKYDEKYLKEKIILFFIINIGG